MAGAGYRRFRQAFLAAAGRGDRGGAAGPAALFPAARRDGKLLPHFITISNIQSRKPAEVKHGNERVIVPRLTDAMFFWDLDKGARLDARVDGPGTDGVPEGARLLRRQAKRVAALAENIARDIGGDTATGAPCAPRPRQVRPALQPGGRVPGAPGQHRPLHRRAATAKQAEVARAIEEQYLPRFAGDRLPATRTGQALAIADKLDTLCGIFAIGQKPTGDKDPSP